MSFAFLNRRPAVAEVRVPPPSDGILLSAQSASGSGVIQFGSGILMEPGRCFTTASLSLWTLDGREVSMGATPLKMRHPDTSYMSVYVHKSDRINNNDQFWLRTSTPPTIAHETPIVAPRVPFGYFMMTPEYATKALPSPYKLPTWAEMMTTPDMANWANSYFGWILDEMRWNVDWETEGILQYRVALYGRAHNLQSMGLMRGESFWLQRAHRLMAGGTTTGERWLHQLSQGLITVGNEWNLDAIEIFLGYLLTGCEDYVLANNTIIKQLHDIGHFGYTPGQAGSPGGTYYTLQTGWDRVTARFWQGANMAINMSQSVAAGIYLDVGGTHLINTGTFSAKIDNILRRVVSGTGITVDSLYAESASLRRDEVDPTKLFISSTVPQLNPNGTNVDIPSQSLSFPASALSMDNGFTRIISTKLAWNGSSVILTSSIHSPFTSSVTSATATSITDSSKNFAPNVYNSGKLFILSGTGAGQTASISSHNGAAYSIDYVWSGGGLSGSTSWYVTPTSGSIYLLSEFVLLDYSDIGDEYLPATPSGTVAIGHVNLVVSGGASFIPDTTVIPPVIDETSSLMRYLPYLRTRNLGHKCYMVGNALNAAMQFVDWYPTHPSASHVADTIEQICDDLWRNHWRSTRPSASFPYLTVTCRKNGLVADSSAGGTRFQGGDRALSMYVGQAFPWVAHRKRITDPVSASMWISRSMEISIAVYDSAIDTGTYWFYSSGAMGNNFRSGDEAQSHIFNSFYLRNQVT